MGFQILLLCFAVVIVGGMGSLRGTFLAAFALGLLIAMTARFWGPAAETMVFVVMGVVLVFKPLEV
jgi:branched-subunit amino acid ABC-type transport system permease component